MIGDYTLIVLAAGKNSRANYQNKALFAYDGTTCLENTIRIGINLFKHVLVVGTAYCEDEYKKICDKYPSVEEITIVSGYGTLDALLKVLPFVKTDKVLMCWGDLWFMDDYAFRQTLLTQLDSPCVVPVSYISNPYSWYIMDENFNIKTTIWRKNESNPVANGYFDQSCYFMDKKIIQQQLTDYNLQCLEKGIESKFDLGYEILYKNGSPAKAIVIEYGHVFHFNTQEEFGKLEQFINHE